MKFEKKNNNQNNKTITKAISIQHCSCHHLSIFIKAIVNEFICFLWKRRKNAVEIGERKKIHKSAFHSGLSSFYQMPMPTNKSTTCFFTLFFFNILLLWRRRRRLLWCSSLTKIHISFSRNSNRCVNQPQFIFEKGFILTVCEQEMKNE